MEHWLITGDTHGDVMGRLAQIDQDKYQRNQEPTTGLIILGDAGINFYLNKTDRKNKKAINESGYAVYCVRGNHEERPENIPGMISRWDEEVQGLIYVEPEFPNIRYLMDGAIYTFGNRSALVIGGAYSVDKYYRLEQMKGRSWTGWFKDEQLTPEEMDTIAVEVEGTAVDMVLTHTCPASWQPFDLFLTVVDQSTVDKAMEDWLENLKSTFDWSIWLFGHFHDNRLVRPGVEMFYNDIEDMNDIWNRWSVDDEPEWWMKKDPNYHAGV